MNVEVGFGEVRLAVRPRQSYARMLLRACRRILRLSRRAPRRLRLCESLTLGDRRFVAVVEFEQSRFLLGGTAGSLVLLARLEKIAAGTAAEPTNPADPSQQNHASREDSD
jgi:flagellar biogenesis protein FliO